MWRNVRRTKDRGRWLQFARVHKGGSCYSVLLRSRCRCEKLIVEDRDSFVVRCRLCNSVDMLLCADLFQYLRYRAQNYLRPRSCLLTPGPARFIRFSRCVPSLSGNTSRLRQADMVYDPAQSVETCHSARN